MPYSNCLLDLGMLLVSFWFSLVVQCAHKHIHFKSLQPRSLATIKVDVVRSTSLCGVIPYNHWQCKLPLGLISNTSPADFPQYKFSKAAIFIKYHGSRHNFQPHVTSRGTGWGEGCMWLIQYSSKYPSQYLSQSSLQKGAEYFWELTVFL